MKSDYAIIAVIFVATCLFIIPANAITLNEYGTYNGIIAGGQNVTISTTRTDLCALYGLTPYSGQTNMYIGITNATLPSDYETNDKWFSFDSWTPQYTYPGDQITLPINLTLYHSDDKVVLFGSCSDVKYHSAGYWSYYSYPGSLPAPTANFTGTPLEGVAPLTVTFTDTSLNDTPSVCTYNWSVTPESGVLAGKTGMLENHVSVFSTNGNYTVSHGVSCPGGSNTSTKTDYITVHNLTNTVTTPFTAVDLAFGHTIQGASVSLQDIENNSWTNTTSTGPFGNAYITTLIGHHINGYATALGYEDADLLAVDATAMGHTFYMYPVNYTNVSAGNVSVFINVVDYDNHGTVISGAVVSGRVYGGESTTMTTDSAGIARFVFPNNTDVHFGATKSGYGGTTIVVNTGSANGGTAAVTGTIYMMRNAVTTVPTQTTLPGGGTPTAVVTILPGCEDPTSAACRQAQSNQGLSYLSSNMMMLIQLCVMVTILYLLGVRLGR